MSGAEQQGLQRSADAIKAALSRLSLKESQRKQLETCLETIAKKKRPTR